MARSLLDDVIDPRLARAAPRAAPARDGPESRATRGAPDAGVGRLAVRRPGARVLRGLRPAAARLDRSSTRCIAGTASAPSTWVGLDNYRKVFTDPDLFRTIVQRLRADRVLQRDPGGPRPRDRLDDPPDRRPAGSALAARTVLFLPQVIPLVAAGIAWSWMLSSTGVVNQVLSHIGLGGVTRAWLGDFATALPAVGVIGAWVLLGLCTLLLLAGISKIDPALYEAARLDGAGPFREFVSHHAARACARRSASASR